MKHFPVFGLCLFLFFSTGCEAIKGVFDKGGRTKLPPSPIHGQSTLEEVTTFINRNSFSIRNMQTDDASITVTGVVFPVKSSISFERPKRLRIRGGATSLTGQEIDFGSNDAIFWLWVRRNELKEMYFCRHDQFPTCPLRDAIPIDPDWIVEALGIVEFLPTERHEGPFPTDDGKVQIITRRQTAVGELTKQTVIDPQRGYVLRQEIRSPQNAVLATAVLSEHRYDKTSGIVYAKKVEVQCQGMDGKMTIDIGTPTFNKEDGFSPAQFQMISYDGYRTWDICDPEFLRSRGRGVMVPNAQPVYQQPQPFYQQSQPMPMSQPTPAPIDVIYGGVTPQASVQTMVR